MIDDHNVKQPVYHTHQRFYQQARRYVAEFQKRNQRLPTSEEFSQQALTLLDTPLLALPSVLSDGLMFQQGKTPSHMGQSGGG